MTFLDKLSDQLSSEFSLGENTKHSLDTTVDGQLKKYGALGEFSNKFNHSEQRKYVEEGYLRTDAFNAEPKAFALLMQEPNSTILIKKRMFSSIGENFRPDYMDKEEKLYYKSMKILFKNKCAQVAALEKLSKIQKITSTVGKIDEQLIPLIISLTDSFNEGLDPGSNLFGVLGSSNPLGGKEASNFTKVVDRLRRLYSFGNSNALTTWITDENNIFQSQFGQGTGVMEITNFTTVSTSTSVDFSNPGKFSLNISDPYQAMIVTEYDIEKAIGDATNSFYNHKIVQFGKDSAEQVINTNTNRFNELRRARKASPITFKVNPDTVLGRRLIAILDRTGDEIVFTYDSQGTNVIGIGGFGNSVTVADDYLIYGAVAGFDGLDTKNHKSTLKTYDSELSVFKKLVMSIFNKIQLDANSKQAIKSANENTNYVRRKMRSQFAGQLIIQAMDLIHIYMRSKSQYDNNISTGLRNTFNPQASLNNIAESIRETSSSFQALFNPSDNGTFQSEKAAYVGKDFPNYLWSAMRSQFINENEGMHVFGGIIDVANDLWDDGKGTVSISGTDNSKYFEQGKINFKPGVDNFVGNAFDPLTPFKSKFDNVSSNANGDIPELLDENKVLLGSSKDSGSPLVKSKSGPFPGQPIFEDNHSQDRSVDPTTGKITRVFYAPDGLVYKWKEGIGSLVQFGSSLDLNNPQNVGIPSLTREPFAGQDIMNVLSLLVTGQPYNFANYWKTVISMDGFGRDPQSQQDPAHSYYNSLQNDLTKSNLMWGNFIPFKNLVMNETAYSAALKKQFDITNTNAILESNINKLKDLNDIAKTLGAANAISENNSVLFQKQFVTLESKVKLLQSQINSNMNEIKSNDANYLIINGDQVTFDVNDFINPSALEKQTDGNLRRSVRRQINHLTRRMSYSVRDNEDKNLFIVDDFYDRDYDILAYEQSLTDGIKLFNNEYTSVREKIIGTASLLNLEVFCDTQGHIRVRPPQYNRMPSSIFYRMMYLKKVSGIQVFPKYLDDLFSDQLKSLRERVEIVEDMIRLDCAVLGQNNDYDAQNFILKNAFNKGSGTAFTFISNSDGIVTDVTSLMKSANPDNTDDSNSQSFVDYENIKAQALSNRDLFTSGQRYSAIIDTLTAQNSDTSILSSVTYNLNTNIDNLISRVQTKSGQKIPRDKYLNTNTLDDNGNTVASGGTEVDVFKVTKELSDKLIERQKVVKLFYGALKNATEFKLLDDSPNTASELVTSGSYSNSNIPELFEHMIEDEDYDDYGPGSGSRYVIKNSQIKSMNFSANPPPYTSVEVIGYLNNYEPNALPEDLKSFPGGGNGLVTAMAIDYDMWRNYGFTQGTPIVVPFLSDPKSQCAPYASMILSKNRKNILRGTVTISGNEYMQPGEVVFIEQRGMLYYVNSVRHSMTMGGSFLTTLELTYGHSPGEYIPTYMDIIGKILLKNNDISSYAVNRNSSSNNEVNMGAINKDGSSVENDAPLKKTFSSANIQTINNIVYQSQYIINSNNAKKNTTAANLELRIYYDDNNDIDSDLESFALKVKSIFVQGSIDTIEDGKTTQVSPLPEDNVKIVYVNLSNDDNKKSPSQKAFDIARNQMNSNPSSNTNNKKERDKLRKSLFKYVIDCWVKFDSPSPQTSKGS
jgi:hypothetical protein